MIEHDTIELLRECDAGVKMGIASICEVLDHTRSEALKSTLSDCKTKHEQLQEEIIHLLHRYQDEGKNPNPLAKGMSWIKTNFTLTVDESDQAIAELITDGCNMGVKSLNQYLNQYVAADETAKEITKRLIDLEEKLCIDIRRFL